MTPAARRASSWSKNSSRISKLLIVIYSGVAPQALARIDAAPRPMAPPVPRPDDRPQLAVSEREKSITDGRHVGLDFYDLLIEAFTNLDAVPEPPWKSG